MLEDRLRSHFLARSHLHLVGWLDHRAFAMVVWWWYSMTKVTVFCTTIYILTDFSPVCW
jgi:hypothetical protein